jgi:hypothetical protein
MNTVLHINSLNSTHTAEQVCVITHPRIHVVVIKIQVHVVCIFLSVLLGYFIVTAIFIVKRKKNQNKFFF